jgi:predicted ATP-dependent protease
MRTAVSELGLSARAHDKVIRVARTIADMESEPKIEPQHIEEAIQYRMLDRDVFNEHHTQGNRTLVHWVRPLRTGVLKTTQLLG